MVALVRPQLHLAEPDPPPYDAEAEAPQPASAVDALFRGHQGWLTEFIRRRFGSEAAEDLTQEVFARSLKMATPVLSPRAFLATLARRAAADRFRHMEPAPPSAEAGRSESVFLPDQLERVLLDQMLRKLPPRVREVYLLCRVAGLTYGEAAERCGISVKRVEARMTEAHKRLAALMRD